MKTWNIVADGSRPLADVARDLTKAGLKNVQVLGEIKCITGSAAEKAEARLRRVKGVSDVSESPSIQLPPGDSAETW